MIKTVKSLICFLIDPHRSLSAVTAAIILALSNSGQLRSSHSTAHWINVLLHPLVNTMATSPATTAKKSSAAAFQVASSAEKMAVSVRIGLLFRSFCQTYPALTFCLCDVLCIDIGDFLQQEIKGPAKFSCNSGNCKFEEPAMNDLINQIFGDAYISVTCDGGECLHYSQVPGYVVRWQSFVPTLCLMIYLASSETRHNHLDGTQRC
jgi:hypothetical protein